jgi:hypothetical protein
MANLLIDSRPVMSRRALLFANQPYDAQLGDSMAPWHPEVVRVLGTVERRSG